MTRSTWLSPALLSLLLSIAPVAWSQTGGPLSPEPGEPPLILEYSQIHALLANPDPTPLLRVYSDGRVVVHYPAYMKKAGTYEMHLEPAELEQFVQDLQDTGITEINPETVRQQQEIVRANVQPLGTYFEVSDDTYTVIKVYLDRLEGGLGESLEGGGDNEVTWSNVQIDAQRFPQIDGLQDLAQSERRIRQLLDAPELQPTP